MTSVAHQAIEKTVVQKQRPEEKDWINHYTGYGLNRKPLENEGSQDVVVYRYLKHDGVNEGAHCEDEKDCENYFDYEEDSIESLHHQQKCGGHSPY